MCQLPVYGLEEPIVFDGDIGRAFREGGEALRAGPRWVEVLHHAESWGAGEDRGDGPRRESSDSPPGGPCAEEGPGLPGCPRLHVERG